MKTDQFMEVIDQHIKDGTLKDWAGKMQYIVTPEQLDQFRADNKLESHVKKHLQDGDFKEWVGKLQEVATPAKLEKFVKSVSALLVQETSRAR